MRRTAGHPDIGVLRRFERLSRLDTERLTDLAKRIQVQEADEGTSLVELNSHDRSTVFLLDGRVRLEAHDGHIRVIDHQDPAARSPLCRLRPTRWRASAACKVRYLKIDDQLLEEYLDPWHSDSGDTGYAVSELTTGSTPDDSSPENRLLLRLFDDLNRNRLVLRSLPRVARGLARAIGEEANDQASVGRLLMLDPIMTIKALRTASEPHVAGSLARNCDIAVNRLTIDGVHRLCVHCALLESFRPDNADLTRRMYDWWKRSLFTAALSRTLAERVGVLDPGFASLIGLTCSIGEAAILAYAHHGSGSETDKEALESCIKAQAPDAGRMLLGRWPLPAALSHAAGIGENWWRDTGNPSPDYLDLTIVANLLALNDRGQRGLPAMALLPAARHLSLEIVPPNELQQILMSAHQEVVEAEELLDA